MLTILEYICLDFWNEELSFFTLFILPLEKTSASNPQHPFSEKKGVVRCLQHRARTISGDPDAYQEEILSIKLMQQKPSKDSTSASTGCYDLCTARESHIGKHSDLRSIQHHDDIQNQYHSTKPTIECTRFLVGRRVKRILTRVFVERHRYQPLFDLSGVCGPNLLLF